MDPRLPNEGNLNLVFHGGGQFGAVDFKACRNSRRPELLDVAGERWGHPAKPVWRVIADWASGEPEARREDLPWKGPARRGGVGGSSRRPRGASFVSGEQGFGLTPEVVQIWTGGKILFPMSSP